MLETFSSILADLGLKDNENKVYTTLLEHRSGLFVAEIAKLTGIKRSTVNLIVERLEDKGFVVHHLEGARKLYTAEAPETLAFRFEDSLNTFRALLPLLHAATGSDTETKVRFYENEKGIAEIFRDILRALKLNHKGGQELLAISSGQDLLRLIPEHEKQFIEKRIKERIPLRWIAPDDSINRRFLEKSSNEYREMRFFDAKKYQFNIEIDMYGDKIALVAFAPRLSGVIIENKNLSQSFSGLFNLLWDSLKKK